MRTKHYPFFGALRPVRRVEGLTQEVPAPRQASHKVLLTLAFFFGVLAAPLHGEFVYVTNFYDTILGYSIGSGGVLTAVPGSPFIGFHKPYGAAVGVAGQFLYITEIGNNTGVGQVVTKRIGAGGKLEFDLLNQTQYLPISVAVDPSGQFVYVANGNNTVSGYHIGLGGVLTAIPGSPFSQPTNAFSSLISIAIAP